MATRVGSLFSEQKERIDYFFDCLDQERAEAFIKAIESCKGAVVLSGVGKSAFVAERLSRMLLSIGIRAYFLSPTEALHGDLGAISREDVVIFLSKSGASDELLALAPHVRARSSLLIALVCRKETPLGALVDMELELPLESELCPFDLAPTTSSAIQMLFGDVCIVALMERRGFSHHDYAMNHPAGAIGKQLSLRVSDLMLKGEALPFANPGDRLIDSLVTLSSKGCGCLVIVEEGRLVGIFTDGDLRRTLQKRGSDINEVYLSDVMHCNPRSIELSALAADALRLMQAVPGKFITELPVLNENLEVVGLIRMHQIVSQGIQSDLNS